MVAEKWPRLFRGGALSINMVAITEELDLTKAQGTGQTCSLKRGFVILKFFSIRFTVSGAENTARYIEDFVCRGSLYRGSHILICVYLQNWCGHYSERAISFATKFDVHSPNPWRYAVLTNFFF